jgi:predicted DCC family thiol-disulfide oxidoreductase YuxK
MKPIARAATSRPSSSATTSLATNAGVVLYDGDCALCNGVARFVAANAPAERYTLVPLASPEAEQLLAATGGRPHDDTFVLLDFGQRFEHSDAVLHLALGLRWPYPLAFGLILVPQAWRDAAYTFVAHNRTRLNGG